MGLEIWSRSTTELTVQNCSEKHYLSMLRKVDMMNKGCSDYLHQKTLENMEVQIGHIPII